MVVQQPAIALSTAVVDQIQDEKPVGKQGIAFRTFGRSPPYLELHRSRGTFEFHAKNFAGFLEGLTEPVFRPAGLAWREPAGEQDVDHVVVESKARQIAVVEVEQEVLRHVQQASQDGIDSCCHPVRPGDGASRLNPLETLAFPTAAGRGADPVQARIAVVMAQLEVEAAVDPWNRPQAFPGLAGNLTQGGVHPSAEILHHGQAVVGVQHSCVRTPAQGYTPTSI